MLSFAIPGTVIGVSYILAFNVPPIEITGTGVILVVSFIFRNMPVGVRSGVAAMAQIDKSLDESSMTLGANSFHTFPQDCIAAAATGDPRRPRLQLCPVDDRHLGGDFPRQRRI